MPPSVNVTLRWARPGGGSSSIAAGIGNAAALGLSTGIASSLGPSLISASIGNAIAVGMFTNINAGNAPVNVLAPSIIVWRAA